MKNQKVIISVVSILVIILVWFGAVVALNNHEAEKTQADLVKQANEFRDKGLFVRAYPLYEQALEIKTENNRDIQEDLLLAYYEDQRYPDYLNYVDSLALTADKASADNFLKCAEIMQMQGRVAESVDRAFEGLAEYPDYKPLEDFIETYRYSCMIFPVGASYVGNFASRSYKTAAYTTDEKWLFLDSAGYFTYDTEYEELRNYSTKGLCPVKVDGKWGLVDDYRNKYSIDDTGVDDVIATDGSYILAVQNGKMSYYSIDFDIIDENLKYDNLSLISDDYVIAATNGNEHYLLGRGFVKLSDKSYEHIAINSWMYPSVGGIVMLKENGRWYLCDTNGKHITDESFAYAKAPEEEGGLIAVANDDGRWGFIDTTGRLVIPYKYEDANSFSDGLGAVKEYDEWDFIDATDTVKVKLGVENLNPFHDGIAVGKNGEDSIIIKLYFTDKDLKNAKAGVRNEEL